MICTVCPRECRGFGWYNPKLKAANQKTLHACSLDCLDIIHRKAGKMEDPTQNEIDSMMDAGQAGGEFLEAIGKAGVPMIDLDPNDFMGMVDAICTGFCDAMRAKVGFSLREKDAVPF